MNSTEVTASKVASPKSTVRFWETGRVLYNALLSALAVGWIILTWPHFLPAFEWRNLALLLVLAAIANVCYCAAYPVDLAIQNSPVRWLWPNWRRGLWIAGTLFALLLEWYWIADEIYPDVHP